MPTTIFVADPSAEAEGIAQLLRGRGYLVADVPLSMLVARVAVQCPRVLLADADAEGALETIGKMREIPEADSVDVIFLGAENGAIGNVQGAFANDGSGFFARPVEVTALLMKIEALTGGPSGAPMARPSTPPPSVSSMQLEAPRRPGTLPPPSMRDLGVLERASPAPRAAPSAPRPPGISSMPPLEERRVGASVSSELEALLAEAEQRIGGQVTHESIFPSPEEEIEAVLPADVLASLDEPIDDDDDEDIDVPAHAKGTTSGGSKMTTGHGGGTGAGTGGGAITNTGQRGTSGGRAATEPPPPPVRTHGGTHAGTTAARHLTDLGAVPRSDPPDVAGRAPTVPPPTVGAIPQTTQPHSGEPSPRVLQRAEIVPGPGVAFAGLGLGPSAPMPSVLAPGDAAQAMAHAIVNRATGAFCIEAQDGVRRAVLREGDLVTAASGVDAESLLAFLVARGDLPRDEVQRLVGKLPPFGRHAAAALVAHGHLRQDQLLSVLREHAEWILGRMVQMATGTAVMESEPPGRLRGEPSVFGGSTGAEVFVEIVRRVIAPEDAIARLGGASSRIGDGQYAQLVDECALEPSIGERLQNARGNALEALLVRSPEPDVASVVYALELLGVFEMHRSGAGPVEARAAHPAPSVDALDEDAVRARVRARLQLVEEGDYFALLGVSRDATSYEVRRAFLELRRAFEPARILTPQIADLSHDVRKIANVLDEAYEILKDTARRERYRRAIDGARA
jgi:hypothetical protein